MSLSPLAYADSLRIGVVDFVSPDEIKVLLDIDAPDNVALNTGTPRAFPRVNGYVLIPADQGHLVAQVEWITVERSKYPQRKGLQDFGLIDLPYPLRKIKLNPLGVLFNHEEQAYKFRRGVGAYPTVGDPVLLPTQSQLRAIVESGENRHIKIGVSPLAASAEVKVDPDRIFGRHLAVLGNTGSGKSCSVAGLIRWSLQAAARETEAQSTALKPNARCIILDPNGEYSQAFRDLDSCRTFALDPREKADQLRIPLWFWSSKEWSAFVRASEGAQRPMLRRALREMRIGQQSQEQANLLLRRKISTILIMLRAQERTGQNYEGWKFGPRLATYGADIAQYAEIFSDHKASIEYLHAQLTAILQQPGRTYQKNNGSTGYNDFPSTEIQPFIDLLHGFCDSLGGVIYEVGPNEDTPLPFDGPQFADHLETLAAQESNPQFFDYLVMRVRMLLADQRVASVICGDADMSLADWLTSYIGGNEANGTVTVIDLSLVPAEIVHILTAVIARMTLEALQRYRMLNEGRTLPTVLVMEEAHTFIKHYKDDNEQPSTAAICCQVFEKIAREGRKFGLGLVLSSQRPVELSPTVLSQCNTFLLHRISNDQDQALVQKLVPDNLRGLLRDLPSLPARQAILLGWASELPTLVEMTALPPEQQPQSKDPDFWAVWSRKVERTVDWQRVADDWQQLGRETGEPSAKPASTGGKQ